MLPLASPGHKGSTTFAMTSGTSPMITFTVSVFAVMPNALVTVAWIAPLDTTVMFGVSSPVLQR